MDKHRLCQTKSLGDKPHPEMLEASKYFNIASSSSNPHTLINDVQEEPSSSQRNSSGICLVCGDDGAKMHYGILACLGCKLCFLDERNSCRYCRLQQCLRVGMDPASVRPDRDFTGKQRQNARLVTALSKQQKDRDKYADEMVSLALKSSEPNLNQAKIKQSSKSSNEKNRNSTDWVMRLPVDMRTMLMTLLNIEAKIVRGDTSKDASEVYPLGINTIREIIVDPQRLRGRRTAMRYEPYRMAKKEELAIIVYRRLIAAIDWVESLVDMIDDGLAIEDKIALVKWSFSPLALLKAAAKTSMVTERDDLLCLCNFAYVPRNIAKAYSDTYHLDNGLVDRLIDQLVQPFRRIHLKDEELVCMSAITVLNSMAKELSREAAAKVNKLRERVNDTLYQIIRESRKEEPSPASQFGNLLLYIPIATDCANLMNENLRFALTFSPQGGIPLLSSVFGCFPVEPFLESEFKLASIIEKIDEKGININVGKNLIIICKNAETQTDGNGCRREPLHRLKRRFPSSFTSPVEDDTTSDFILLQAPGSYTLAEMFDDCANNYDSPGPSRTSLTLTNSIPYTSQQQLLQHLAPPRGKRGPSNKRLIQLYQTSEIIQSPCSSNSLPSSSEVAQRRLTLDSTYKTHAITQHLRSVASANSLETTAPLRSQLSSTNIVAEQNPVNKVGNNTPQINSYGTTLQIDYLTNSDATQSIIMRSDVPTNLNDNFSYEQQHNCQQQQFPAFHPQLQELSSFSNNSIHHTPCEATLGWSAMPQQQYPKADRTQLFNQPPMVFTNEYSTRFSLMQQTNYVNESHYCTLPRTPHYASQKPTTTQSAADQLYDGINFNSTHKY